MSSQAALTAPQQRQRATIAKTRRPAPVPPVHLLPVNRQRQRSREAAELLLLIHAGWVGMALVIVACIPLWKANFDQHVQPGAVGVKPLALKPSPDQERVDRTVSGTQANPLATQETLFIGGSNSLVARTVGHAEGTRTPDGRKTRAYYGHRDPGNGAWNLGSFSFQHCREVRYACSTPEQADDRQLQRLQSQHDTLQRRAATANLQLTLAEALNGIDLANQSPLAALSDLGYIDRLSQAKQKGLNGQDAILNARVWSYWNPQKNRWDAPGLGNTETGIRHDQERRLLAIARATALAQQLAELPANQRSLNILRLQPEAFNPYDFSRQRSSYLWWDAGYWDAKLSYPRQVPPGYEPAYDRGFTNGLNP